MILNKITIIFICALLAVFIALAAIGGGVYFVFKLKSGFENIGKDVVKVDYPGGGETLTLGSLTTIKYWAFYDYCPHCDYSGEKRFLPVDIFLDYYGVLCSEAGDRPCPPIQSSLSEVIVTNYITKASPDYFRWKTGEVYRDKVKTVQEGKYSIKVCKAGTSNTSNPVCDSSDTYFTISSSTPSTTPHIDSITPPCASACSAITIHGTNLKSENGGDLDFSKKGILGASYSLRETDTASEVHYIVPSGASPDVKSCTTATTTGTYKVYISNDYGKSNVVPFAVEEGSLCVMPSITRIVPSEGPVGTKVTVSGSGFTKNNSIHFSGGLNVWEIISATSDDGNKLIFSIPKEIRNACPIMPAGLEVNCPPTKNTAVGLYKFTVENILAGGNAMVSKPINFYVTRENTPNIKVSVRTSKQSYLLGENVDVIISAKNDSWLPQTLTFNSNCQADYKICSSEYDCVWHEPQQCFYADSPTNTTITIAPKGKKEWVLTHDASKYRIPTKEYELSGEVLGYGYATTTLTIYDYEPALNP